MRITVDGTVSKELDNGTWDFMVIGWQGSDTLTGTPKCDHVPGITLEGTNIDVNMAITEAKCTDLVTFYPTELVSCNIDLASVSTTEDCSQSDTRGSANSFRIMIPELGTTTANPLMSECITTQENSDSGNTYELDPVYISSSSYQIPVSTQVNLKVNVSVQAFTSSDCTGTQEEFGDNNGLSGTPETKHEITNNSYFRFYTRSGTGHSAYNHWININDDITNSSTTLISYPDGSNRTLNSYHQITNIAADVNGEFTVLTTSGSFTDDQIKANDTILWAVMAGTSSTNCGTKIGSYGWGEVASTSNSNTINLESDNPIIGDFDTNTNSALTQTSYNTDTAYPFCRIQLIRLALINNIKIINDGNDANGDGAGQITLSPPPFNLSSGTGGVLALNVDHILQVTSGAKLVLNAKGMGFSGGNGHTISGSVERGDGYGGKSQGTGNSNPNNNGGGSAGSSYAYSGGGGAGATSGSLTAAYPRGGSPKSNCTPNMRCMVLGGGGGGGLGDSGNKGGDGGGIVLLGAGSLEGEIWVEVSGEDGTLTSGSLGGGGGGGGMALVLTDKIDNAHTDPELNISKGGGLGITTSGSTEATGGLPGGDGFGMVGVTSGGLDNVNSDNNLPYISSMFDRKSDADSAYFLNTLPTSGATLSDTYTYNLLDYYRSSTTQISFHYSEIENMTLPQDIIFTTSNGTSFGVFRIFSINTSTGEISYQGHKYHLDDGGHLIGTTTKTPNTIADEDANNGYRNDIEFKNSPFRINFPFGARWVIEPD